MTLTGDECSFFHRSGKENNSSRLLFDEVLQYISPIVTGHLSQFWAYCDEVTM
jgi:hypothetical protein